eukprot:11890596-Alexandrium_andersonii.AAC.1
MAATPGTRSRRQLAGRSPTIRAGAESGDGHPPHGTAACPTCSSRLFRIWQRGESSSAPRKNNTIHT